MKTPLNILLIIGLLLCATLGLPLAIGIWLPDLITAPRRTLAEQRLPSGHSFRVIQYWNRCDFYNTELWHTSPNGKGKTYVLDPDDGKRWSVSLTVDESHKTATIALGSGRVKNVEWY